MMTTEHRDLEPLSGPWRRLGTVHSLHRLLAAALDLPIVAALAILAGGLGLVVRQLGFEPWTPIATQAFAFIVLVAPVAVTLAILEASSNQATPGKRRLGLAVVDAAGRRISPARSLARSAVKLAPWQIAHVAVIQLAAGATEPVWLAMSLTAQALVIGSIAMMALDPGGRALHDLIAGTRVVPAGSNTDRRVADR